MMTEYLSIKFFKRQKSKVFFLDLDYNPRHKALQ